MASDKGLEEGVWTFALALSSWISICVLRVPAGNTQERALHSELRGVVGGTAKCVSLRAQTRREQVGPPTLPSPAEGSGKKGQGA